VSTATFPTSFRSPTPAPVTARRLTLLPIQSHGSISLVLSSGSGTWVAAVYAYHRRAEATSLYAERDVEEHPALREALAPYFTYWERVRDVLVAGWGLHSAPHAPPAARLRAAIGHAISFSTWRSLVREQGIEDEGAVDLMAGMLRCLNVSTDEASERPLHGR
jgi:hypothetical protein